MSFGSASQVACGSNQIGTANSVFQCSHFKTASFASGAIAGTITPEAYYLGSILLQRMCDIMRRPALVKQEQIQAEQNVT